MPLVPCLEGYLGDGYPRCFELPPRHFLRRGAKYRLLTYEGTPETSPRLSGNVVSPGHLALGGASPLCTLTVPLVST